MGTMKLMKNAFIILIVLVVIYFGYRIFVVFQKGYSWQEMDWDRSGATSLREFFDSSDVGVRLVNQNGQDCREYYCYKDGLAIKTGCDHSGGGEAK